VVDGGRLFSEVGIVERHGGEVGDFHRDAFRQFGHRRPQQAAIG